MNNRVRPNWKKDARKADPNYEAQRQARILANLELGKRLSREAAERRAQEEADWAQKEAERRADLWAKSQIVVPNESGELKPLFAYIVPPDDFQHSLACDRIVLAYFFKETGDYPPTIMALVPTGPQGTLQMRPTRGYRPQDRPIIRRALRRLDQGQ